jgi:glycosyltransferase 2 family protein
MKKNILKSLFGLAIGAIFLFFTLNNKPLAEIFASLKEARLSWLLLSVLGLIMTFYLRAFRWKVLLESSDANPVRYNVIYSLILGYFVNSFTPKFGEIIRCTSLKKTDKIPTSVSFWDSGFGKDLRCACPDFRSCYYLFY